MTNATIEERIKGSHALLAKLQCLQQERVCLLKGKEAAPTINVAADIRSMVLQQGLYNASSAVLDVLLSEGGLQDFGDALCTWLDTRAPQELREYIGTTRTRQPPTSSGITALPTLVLPNVYDNLPAGYVIPPMPTCHPTLDLKLPPEYLPTQRFRTNSVVTPVLSAAAVTPIVTPTVAPTPVPKEEVPKQELPKARPTPELTPVEPETPTPVTPQVVSVAVAPVPIQTPVEPEAEKAASPTLNIKSMMMMKTKMHKRLNKAQQQLQEKKQIVNDFFDKLEGKGDLPDEEPEQVRQLGKGSYGVVDHVIYRKTGREVARKTVVLTQDSCSCVSEAQYRTRQIEREIQMSEFDCPYILKSLGVYVNRGFNEIYLESTLMDGDLEYLLGRLQKRIPDVHVAYIIFCVTSALQYLHTMDRSYEGGVSSFVHRDLKPDNILLNRHGNVLMTDFGVSKEVKSVSDQVPATAVGNYAYMAPETMTSSSYARSSDLWSVGMITLHLMCGKHPVAAQGYDLCRCIQKFDFNEPVGWQKPSAAPECLGMVVGRLGGGVFVHSDCVDVMQVVIIWGANVNNTTTEFVSKLLTKLSNRMTAGEALLHPMLTDFKVWATFL